MIASINRKDLRPMLNIESHLKILLVLALGKPKEEVVMEVLSIGEMPKPCIICPNAR
jgi:hypothetical protein